MAKGKNPDLQADKYKPTSRPAPQDNFNKLFPTAAHTIGAPRPPAISALTASKRIGNSRDAIDIMLDKMSFVRENNGIVLAAVDILTHPEVLNALVSVNASIVVTKCKPSMRLVRMYNQITSGQVRSNLPGRIIPHLLLQKDGGTSKEDFGILGGLRILGNFYDTMRMHINEKRPRMHVKFWIGMIPLKDGKWKLVFGQDGTMNWSINAEASFEQSGYTEDPVYLDYLYQWWAHYYSLSEGLYDFSRGLTPKYVWMPRKQTFKKHAACKGCGNNTFAPYWAQDDYRQYPTEVLRCVVCNQLVL